jgi:1,4-dihydroxy-2-naphthoate octaprenyltransferase
MTNALVGGVLVPALAFVVMTGTLTQEALIFAIPFTLWGLAFIVAVEIPDVEADRLGGKRTFVARHGRKAGFAIVGLCLMAATGYICARQWLRGGAYPLDLQPLILFSCLPLAVGGYGAVRRPVEQGPATHIVTLFVASLIGFFILTDSYMIYQVAQL